MSGLAFGVMRLDRVGRQHHWRLRALRRVNTFARNPKTEFLLGCSRIMLGLLEHFAFDTTEENSLPLQAHHGMLLYGVSMLSRLGTDVFFGLELAKDSFENAREQNHKAP